MRLNYKYRCITVAQIIEWFNQTRHGWSEGQELKEAKLTGKEYFSVKEFKDRVGVSSNLIYEQLRKGVLPSVRLGGRILIPVDALEVLMERQDQEETPTVHGSQT